MKTALKIAGAVILGAAIAAQFFPTPESTVPFQNLPLQGNHFTGKRIELSENEIANLDGADAAKYLFQFQGRTYLIVAINGQNNRHAVHDPTFCLKGSGQKVENLDDIKFSNGTAARIRVGGAEGEPDTEQLRWFSTADSRFTSFLQYRFHSGLRRLTFGKSGNEPILITVKAVAPEDEQSPWDKAFATWVETDLAL